MGNFENRKSLITNKVLYKIFFIGIIVWILSICVISPFMKGLEKVYLIPALFLPSVIGMFISMILIIKFFNKEVTNRLLFYYSLLSILFIAIVLFLLYVTDDYKQQDSIGGNSL